MRNLPYGYEMFFFEEASRFFAIISLFIWEEALYGRDMKRIWDFVTELDLSLIHI